MLTSMSFVVVGDLLEDTITRSAKNQSDADGELSWLRKRLDIARRDPRSRGKTSRGDKVVSTHPRAILKQAVASAAGGVGAPGNKENPQSGKSVVALGTAKAPLGMSVLQLRRFLKAIGQPTVGLKAVLTSRVEKAVSSGAVQAYVDSTKGKPQGTVECAGERRKTEAMLEQAESLLQILGATTTTTTTTTAAAAPVPTPAPSTDAAEPKRPLRDSQSSANDNTTASRSSLGSEKAAPKLSGQEQDAVVAKIRSAAKMSASPEKKLPFQDDDTPNTKGARLKKEMEDRLARQNQLQTVKQQQQQQQYQKQLLLQQQQQQRQQQSTASAFNSEDHPRMPTTPPPAAPTSVTPPTTVTPTPVTPPSARPPVPSSPAPMPPASPSRAASPARSISPSRVASPIRILSPPRATVPPPPPTAEAPQPVAAAAAAAPPAPQGSAPRPTDLTNNTPSGKLETPTTVPAAPLEVAPVVPVPEAAKSNVVVDEGGVEGDAAASRGGGGRDYETGGGVDVISPSVEKQATSPGKGFGSPGRHRSPVIKTPSRKANPFTKDSISTPGPSGLKAAAHKAFNRITKDPSTPEAPSPTTGSATQSAFAKFRAMDSNSKKGGQSFKVRPSPPPKGNGLSPAKPSTPQQPIYSTSVKLDFGKSATASTPAATKIPSSTSASASASVSSAKRDVQEAQSIATAARAKADAALKAKTEAAAAESRARAAKDRAEAKARAKTAADQAAADEARRDAQARAEAKAREAALKASAEREAALRKEEQKKAREEDRKKTEKRAAAIEAVRKAEDKKKADKRAAAAALAAAKAEKATEAIRVAEEADTAARKARDTAALELERLQVATQKAKPPTPPRPAGAKPPTPPRPLSQAHSVSAGPPPTPPRPGHGKGQGAAAAVVAPGSPWTPAKGTQSSAEARQTALAKKKQEIAKRMDEMRKKKAATPTPAPAPAPAPVPAPAPAPVQKVAPAPKPAPSPVVPKEERESYDAYDVEPESESESGDEEEAAPEIVEPQEASDKSAIPDWARGKALAKILDKQYGGPSPLNPDKIFPEFFTCNLEHIFNTKKTKWDRSSSGNWHTDRLTIAEKLAYQRAMGFDK